MFHRTAPILRDERPYARKDIPWMLDADREILAETKPRDRRRWRLFHYLAGGGLKSFGRTVEQEVADAKRDRFLIAAGVVAVLWLVALIW